MPRQCYYVDAGTRTARGYVAAVVTEREVGYRLMSDGSQASDPWCWGEELAVARRRADEANRRLGLRDRDVEALVGGALAASLAERMRVQRQQAARHRLGQALTAASA